ncbi:unnamed protein product [Ectocarpus sp. 13 AM-2016]
MRPRSAAAQTWSPFCFGQGAKPDVTVVSITPQRSALYVATVCGHEEAAKLLLSAGADARFEDPVYRFSVLHEAACGGYEQLVKNLLIADADSSRLGSAPSRISPLHQAALGGHPSIVSALLLKGPDIDVLDRCGESPLIWAADEGQLAAAEALLPAGANFNIRSTDRNNSSCAALDCAAFHGHAHIPKEILAHGADANARDDRGLTALYTAAGADQAGIVEALIEEGVDVDLMTDDGRTPLAFAACASTLQAMLALSRSGAVVNKCGANKKHTPLHSACCGRSAGLAETVDLLLRWGGDETALTTGGQTPAHLLDTPALLHEPEKPYCSDEDMKRARLLLARTKADGTWRRRSWLIMFRSRARQRTTKQVATTAVIQTNLLAEQKTNVRLRNLRAQQVPLYRM